MWRGTGAVRGVRGSDESNAGLLWYALRVGANRNGWEAARFEAQTLRLSLD